MQSVASAQPVFASQIVMIVWEAQPMNLSSADHWTPHCGTGCLSVRIFLPVHRVPLDAVFRPHPRLRPDLRPRPASHATLGRHHAVQNQHALPRLGVQQFHRVAVDRLDLTQAQQSIGFRVPQQLGICGEIRGKSWSIEHPRHSRVAARGHRRPRSSNHRKGLETTRCNVNGRDERWFRCRPAVATQEDEVCCRSNHCTEWEFPFRLPALHQSAALNPAVPSSCAIASWLLSEEKPRCRPAGNRGATFRSCQRRRSYLSVRRDRQPAAISRPGGRPGSVPGSETLLHSHVVPSRIESWRPATARRRVSGCPNSTRPRRELFRRDL